MPRARAAARPAGAEDSFLPQSIPAGRRRLVPPSKHRRFTQLPKAPSVTLAVASQLVILPR
jgi:hypothetical protein